MRFSSSSPALASLILALVVSACASGRRVGGDRQDGGPILPRDGGPIVGFDSGPVVPPQDSGPIASPDAGPIVSPDSGPIVSPDSGPTGCTSDAACDDGLACNGVERCGAGGACVAGTPPSCDDGIACTVSACVEPTGACSHTPDSALCPPGQTCGATGCVSACSESPCRLTSPQCGCPGGQGCYLSGSVRSCAAAGSAAEGASCTTASSCQPGLVCLNVSSTTAVVNQCGRFCAGDTDCIGNGSLCTYTLGDGAGGTVPGVRVCSRACDPVTSTGCSSNAVCHVYREMPSAGRFLTDCAGPAGFGWEHDFCIDNTDCSRGTFCAASLGECLAYCNTSRGDADCPFSDACYRFATPLVVGGVEYGYCDYW